MERFYWIRAGSLAGSSRPGGLNGARLEDDLDFLRDQGVDAIISLTETSLDGVSVEEAGMVATHVPMIDMMAPTLPQLFDALDAIDLGHGEGKAVVVHCAAGQGRTGTVLAAWLIRQGATTDEAVAEVRAVCDHAVENEAQLAALRAFELGRSWVL